MEQESSGQEEHGEECLHFTDDLAQEPVSQDGEGIIKRWKQQLYTFIVTDFLFLILNFCSLNHRQWSECAE